MFHLAVMGRLELHNADGGIVATLVAQPKRLGLLAYLVVARPAGFRARAEIVQLFWPEYDDRRARNALNTAVAYLRRALGEDAVISRGDELGIDPSRVSCDVEQFRKAARDGRWAEALELYGGELLPGLAAESVGHERWIETERRELLREAVAVANAAQSAALAQNDLRGAHAAARRALALAPYEEQAIRSLMDVHIREGDVTAAVRAYDGFADTLRRALELEPSPSLQEWAASLRRTSPPSGLATRMPERVPEPRPDGGVAPGATPPTPGRARMLGLAAAWAAALIVVAGAGWQLLHGRAQADADSGALRTAVLPFTTHGGESITYLGDGLADIIAGRLDGVGDLRAVDPSILIGYLRTADTAPPLDMGIAAARHFTASYFVLGNVTEAGDQLVINASLYDSVGRLRARANAAAAERDLLSAADELVRKLVGGQFGGPTADLLREAAVTTRSLPALKAYLEGERAYRENRLTDMRDAMERAVAEDSTFALAHYRLAIAAEWTGGSLQLIHRAVENAMRYRERLGDRHRLLLDALQAYWGGNVPDAHEAYRLSVIRYPDDVETWYRQAELQFHRMPGFGQPFTSARPAFERVLALQPDNAGALHHLIRIAAVEGRGAALDSLTERALVNAEPNQRIELRVFRAFAIGDEPERARAAVAAAALPFGVLPVLALRVASYTGDVRGAEAVVAPATRPSSPAMSRLSGHAQLAELAAAGGRWREARRRLQELEPTAPVLALAMEASLGILPFAPMSREELLALRQRVAAWNVAAVGLDSVTGVYRVPQAARPALRRFFLGALSLRLGDVASATTIARDLARDTIAVRFGFPTLLRAIVAHATRRPSDGLAALDSLTGGDASVGLVRQDALARYLRAELLQATGRDAEAAGWFGTFGELAGWDLAFVAPGELARASIAERRGDRVAAAHHCTRALTLWKGADAELRPLIEQAQSQLARLGRIEENGSN